LHIDDRYVDFMRVLDLVDELDAIPKNEDIEEVWDYP